MENLAFNFAESKHKGQKYGSRPYMFHVLGVAEGVPKEAKTVALLHDVLEDTPTTLDEFFFVTPEERLAILAITRLKDEDYFDYIKRVKANRLASIVKLADLRFNLGHNPRKRNIEKYKKSINLLYKGRTGIEN